MHVCSLPVFSYLKVCTQMGLPCWSFFHSALVTVAFPLPSTMTSLPTSRSSVGFSRRSSIAFVVEDFLELPHADCVRVPHRFLGGFGRVLEQGVLRAGGRIPVHSWQRRIGRIKLDRLASDLPVRSLHRCDRPSIFAVGHGFFNNPTSSGHVVCLHKNKRLFWKTVGTSPTVVVRHDSRPIIAKASQSTGEYHSVSCGGSWASQHMLARYFAS